MKDLGKFIQYDLENAEDCMELVDKFGFTNSQIRECKAHGHRYQSISKELMIDGGE